MTAADRPSVTDNARAEPTAAQVEAAYTEFRTSEHDGRALVRAMLRAAGRAETTTATNEGSLADVLGLALADYEKEIERAERSTAVGPAIAVQAGASLAAAVRGLLATARTRPTRTIYSVQAWEDADDIRASWVTGYGQYTHSRSDAEATLRHQERQHPDTTFRLAQAQVTPWTEAE